MAGQIEPVGVTTGLPYRRICLVQAGPQRGTGWFFGPSLVVTAAHVVGGAAPNAVSIWPARHDEHDTPFGKWTSAEIAVSSNGADYAGVFLREPVGERVGTFGIASLGAVDVFKQVVVTGYTLGDDGRQPFTGSGAVSNRGEEDFDYGIQTVQGQSGAPVWLADNSDLVAGIHVGNGQALLITDAVLEQLLAWRSGSL